MLILPVERGKFILPMARKAWMPSSQTTVKDMFGNDGIQTRYRVRARLNDSKKVVWQGWCDDREDFDAFLFSIATDQIVSEPALWDTFNEVWPQGYDPDIHPFVTYEFATVTFLTTPGSNTYTSPSDWNNANNTIEGMGGGGSGASSTDTTQNVSGGGGGEYRKIVNFSVTTAGTTTYNYVIGAGGTSVSQTSGTKANGNNGSATTFNTSSLIANFGNGGVFGTTIISGGSGGTGGTGAAANANGGRGGNCTAANAQSITGGGGAAGPNGAGGNGGDIGTATRSSGGNGDAGSGGAGSSAGGNGSNPSAGGNGTEWDASHGSGGGGAGASGGTVTIQAGAGGLYSGGGGACTTGTGGTSKSGAGAQGILVITYTPIKLSGFNLAMFGM